MHETYRSLADLIIRERVREAAEWRLAEQASGSRGSGGLGARLRRLLGGAAGQPPTAAAAPLSADRPACA
jgi:hypothetical protein